MDAQRKFNIENKMRLREEQKVEDKKFAVFWKNKNKEIEEKENQIQELQMNIKKQFQNFNHNLAKEKQAQIEQDILQKYIDAEEIKKARMIGEQKFMGYAEKCLAEWKSDGKNVIPILLELQKYKEQLNN